MRTKKIAKRRVHQAKRMTELRLLRRQKKEAGLKPSSVRRTAIEDRCEKFVREVLARKQPQGFCPHFLIGSSLLWDTLRTGYTTRKAHQYAESSLEARLIGASGEEAFRRSCREIRKIHPFAVSRLAPWVCTAPDFIVDSPAGCRVVEVKTFGEAQKALAFFHTLPKRVLVQVWLELELLQLQKGQIRVYWSDRVGQTVTLVGNIEVTRATSLFDRSLFVLSALRWSEFLEDFFDINHLNPLKDYLDTLALRLSKRFKEESAREKDKENRAQRMEYLTYRPFPKECQYWLGSQLEDEGVQVQKPVHAEYFKGHKFVSRSKRTRSILLDQELRSSLVQELLQGLSQPDRHRLDQLLGQLDAVPTTAQLHSKMTKRALQRIDEQHQPSRADLLLKRLDAKEQELTLAIAKIGVLTEQVTALKAENDCLKAKLAQKKAPNKRKLLKAYRKRNLQRQKAQTSKNALLDFSETKSTGRGHPRRK